MANIRYALGLALAINVKIPGYSAFVNLDSQEIMLLNKTIGSILSQSIVSSSKNYRWSKYLQEITF